MWPNFNVRKDSVPSKGNIIPNIFSLFGNLPWMLVKLRKPFILSWNGWKSRNRKLSENYLPSRKARSIDIIKSPHLQYKQLFFIFVTKTIPTTFHMRAYYSWTLPNRRLNNEVGILRQRVNLLVTKILGQYTPCKLHVNISAPSS